MLKDLAASPDLYKPTIHWQEHEKFFVPELRKYGLNNFRRRKNSIFQSFSSQDHDPIDRYLKDVKQNRLAGIIPPNKSLLFNRLLRFGIKKNSIRKMVEYTARLWLGITLQDKLRAIYEFAKYCGTANGAKPISQLSDSLVGSPKNVLEKDGNNYTKTLLRYYLLYAQSSKSIDYEKISSVMEIGSGGGGQIEVLKKFYPHISAFIFDIPPQLYVAQQYLKAIFGDKVVPYQETRDMKSLPSNYEGKIFVFQPYQIEKIDIEYDLFWNSSSFQEMTPEVVLNYLKFVNSQTQKFAVIHNEMEPIKGTPIEYLVEKEHYLKGLSNFELMQYEESAGQFLDLHYKSIMSVWKKLPN